MTRPTASKARPFVLCHALRARLVVVTVSVAAVVLVLSSAVAWNGDVPGWEESVLEFVNGWPNGLEPLMWFVQQVGNLFAPIVGGLVIFWFTRRWQHLVPFVLVLPLKLGIEKGLVKKLVERERPFVSVGDSVNVRGPAFEGLSFPSGHTTTAFALAVLLSAFVPPKWRPIPIVWAALVGLARLYYGEHNLLDVIAGAALGTTFATMLWYFFLNRHVDPRCDCIGTCAGRWLSGGEERGASRSNSLRSRAARATASLRNLTRDDHSASYPLGLLVR